ncbi:DUF748 domain-containing protein [Desulfuromonas acetexigens]|uniref:DUF748 domain-containing protein n=1 Tax=Trichloromonas acetexigens TaxID=38815 RepID=A0A550JF53_9BACT|nr:DUF748 domain-containing protein [Desulfuromonas acetexigens]TRO81829.1 DUF748 domain-containing protein [Desulfuromonas acetexigens]
MKRWMKWTLGIVVGLLILGSATLLALPNLVRHFGGNWLKENTGRTLTLGDLSLNVLTWKLVVEDFALSEPNSDERFAGLTRLEIQVSPKSIIEKALIVNKFDLVAPYAQVFKEGDVFNFSDFAGSEKPEEAPPEEAEEPAEPFLFSLNNLRIVDGEALYVERKEGAEVQRHSLRELNLAVPFIGNVPHLLDQYITPALSLVLNDARVRGEGQLKLFTEAVEASVDLLLSDVDIPFYLKLVPTPLPVQVRSGKLGSDLQLVYRATAEKAPELEVGGKVRLSAIDVAEPSGADLLKLPQVNVDLATSKVLESQVLLDGVYIYSPMITLDRNQSGELNFARLAQPAPASAPAKAAAPEPQPAKEKAAAEKAAPFLATVKTLLVKNGRLAFRDAVPEGGFQRDISALDLTVRDFSTAPASRATYDLSLRTDREEQLKVDGGLVLEPLAVETTVDLKGLSLKEYHPYLSLFLNYPLAGAAAARAGLDFREGVLKVADAALDVQNLQVPFGGEEELKLAHLKVDGVQFDDARRQLEIGRVELAEGAMVLSMDRDGRVSPLNLLRETEPPPQKLEQMPVAAALAEAKPPLSYRVGEIAARKLRIDFTDKMPKKPARHLLAGLDLSLKNLAGPEAVVSPFRLKSSYNKGGYLDLSGDVIAATGKLNLHSRLKGIALTDFVPYFPDSVRMILADGQLDTDLEVRLDPKKAGLTGAFTGNLGIRNFYGLDGEHREELLRWGSLQIDEIAGEIAPFALHVGGIALSDYTARIVIDEKGLLNLSGIVAADEPETTAGEAEAASAEAASESVKPAEAVAVAEPAPPETTPAAPGPEIAIDAITLQGGTVSFSDRQMQPAFSTTMYQLGGKIGRISTAGVEPAEVDLRGHLENLSPLQISGQINPLAQELFADIKLSFKDIELSPATPYTGTYLGYTVEKGKLTLDLEYKIAEKALRAQNRVLIDQFTFGDKVESEQAVNLPVKLAVALLKDRNGAIKLDIPVAGRTDDPEFSIFSVVLTVLKNLMIKAATSPLSLLQSAFGGGGEEATAAIFPFGSSVLPPAEQQKLDTLAAMLKDRPALRLELAGFVDADKDPEGYRKELLEQRLRKAKFLELVDEKENLPGQTEANVEILTEERERYLEEVYDQADFPKPRNVLGFNKSLPAEEMEKLILANTEVGPPQLQALAQARMAAVVNYLTGPGGLPTDRLFQTRPDINKQPKEKDADGNRVEFDVVAR